VCVCVWVRERERERVRVIECVWGCVGASMAHIFVWGGFG